MLRPRFIALLLLLGTLAVYLPAAHHGFTLYDDDDYVTENPMVEKGLTWAGVKWAFGWHACNWHPLTWLSHMADCQFFGLDAGMHHSVNVLFHAANSILLLLLLVRWTNALLAQRLRRRAVRLASAARRIRRVDRRAQGRVEHVLRPADAAGLQRKRCQNDE